MIFCSSFGYSLASVDFNGDGFKDLVVGAPFYASQGAAYIFMNTKDKGMHGLYSGPPEYIGTWGLVLTKFWQNFDSIFLIIHLNNKIGIPKFLKCEESCPHQDFWHSDGPVYTLQWTKIYSGGAFSWLFFNFFFVSNYLLAIQFYIAI